MGICRLFLSAGEGNGEIQDIPVPAGTFVQGRSLPIHFQEAALVLAVEDLSVLDRVAVRSEIVQRYKQFQKDILKLKNSSDGLSWLYQQYGDTFWFYYYCKN